MSIFLIFIFAFLIRLMSLNQSLWLDEAIVARVVSQYNFFEIISKFSPFDFHPPLYYLFMKLWTSFFGFSEISLRMPSVIFSLMTAIVIYKIGKILKDKKLGFWSAILFLFNPLIVYYSQEARMYMMTTFFITTSFYYFLKLRNNHFSKDLIFFNLFLILSFFSFYGSIFLIIGYLIYFLLKKKKYFFQVTFIFFVSFSFLILPLLFKQLINASISLKQVLNWSLVLGNVNIKNLLLVPIKFIIGRISFYPKYFYWGAVIFTLIFFVDVIKNYYDFYYQKAGFDKKNIKLILFFLIFPIILGFLFSIFVPMLNYFKFLYLLPFFVIYLSYITVFTKEKFNLYILFIFIFFSFVYLFIPYFHREDWKSLASYLQKNKIKKIYMITSSFDPLIYYDKKIKVISLKNLCDRDIFLNNEKIYVIPYKAEIWGVDYKKCLQLQGKNQLSSVNFRGLSLEYYR
ncbi:MAG: hypothetical protein KatS3mg092_0539 [Patescibacteria group bacterium]|nr:MAG: hypothetical protein KatS3mg092_0539 [Patescibacteria group bacterium]